MFFRGTSAFAAAVMASLVFVAGSPAQSGIDPSANSPAGQVYQLPFDKGRKDAAPRGGSGKGTPTGSPGESSIYRSENNFGSSSRVPGKPKHPGETAPISATADPGDPGDPFKTKAIALLAMIGVVGGIGFAARRAWGA